MTVPVHNATGVAIGGRAILIEGVSGSGKSSLALALMDRGAQLIGDDAVTLEMRGGTLWAKPPPNIVGKLEIRNLGLVDIPVTEAPVALVLRLEESAPRYIDGPELVEIYGIGIPLIRLTPHDSIQPLKAEWALRLFGQDTSD